MSGQPITSESCSEVLVAFHLALASIARVTKTANVDVMKSDGVTLAYSYKHATVSDTIEEVKRACALHALTVSQIPGQRSTEHGDFTTLATLIIHESGEWLTFEPLAMKVPSDPQKVGGAITFARRYALTSIFGIPTDDDDAVEARQGIEDDTAELVALADRTKRANKLLPIMKGLDDEQKATLKSVVWDEIARQIMPAQLHEDEEMLSLVETTLSNMGVTA